MQVMAAPLAGGGVLVVTCRGKDPLPRPLATGVWILAIQGVRELDPAGACAEIGFVQSLDDSEVFGQARRSRAPLPRRMTIS